MGNGGELGECSVFNLLTAWPNLVLAVVIAQVNRRQLICTTDLLTPDWTQLTVVLASLTDGPIKRLCVSQGPAHVLPQLHGTNSSLQI